MASPKRLDARVTGRVQGVGFRHFVKTTARPLGLTGWVRNEADGSVTVCAEGPPDALDRLDAALREGPRGADVERVEASRSDAEGAFERFEVRFP